MMDFLEIGSSPCGEDCAQVGTPGYYEKARKECIIFKRQLIRQFGEPPLPGRYDIKSFPHDFGNYLEVCIIFNDEIEETLKYAYNVENNTPENWDEISKAELKAAGLT